MSCSLKDAFENLNGMGTYTSKVEAIFKENDDKLKRTLSNAVESGKPHRIFHHTSGNSKEDWIDMKKYLFEVYGPNPEDYPCTIDEKNMEFVIDIIVNILGPGIVAVVKDGIEVQITPSGGTNYS